MSYLVYKLISMSLADGHSMRKERYVQCLSTREYLAFKSNSPKLVLIKSSHLISSKDACGRENLPNRSL
jgi:hypothetical protein